MALGQLMHASAVPAWRPSFSFTRLDGAMAVWAVMLTAVALHEQLPLFLLAIPAAVLSRSRPWAVAALMISSATLLRVVVDVPQTDPLVNAWYASERALAGENPYGGFIYPNGTAYAYGPLGLLTYRLGIPGEIMTALGTSIVLAWTRSWLTLAIFSSVPLFVFTASSGANDHTPTFLLVAGLALMRTHPRAGVTMIAAGMAVKPYIAAWMLPAIGYGGVGVIGVTAAVTAVLWAPVMLWGVGSYIVSARSLEAGWPHALRNGDPSWAIADMTAVRYLAAPIALAGLLVRSWRYTILLGSAVFFVYLGFAPWANTAHLVPLLTATGLALEGQYRRLALEGQYRRK